jgi:hypothetical protein
VNWPKYGIIGDMMSLLNLEAVKERQEFQTELVNADSVRFLADRQSDQQIDVRLRRVLKERTQRNGVSSKKLIAVHSNNIGSGGKHQKKKS